MLPEKVKLAKEKGTKILLLTNDSGDFYFKKPGEKEIMANLDLAAGNKGKFAALMKNNIRQLIIFPELEDFNKILEDKPGIFVALYNELYGSLGLTENFTAKEL